MTNNDILANALSKIMNSEKVGKSEVNVMPISKVVVKVLEIMNDHGYIGGTEELLESNVKGGALKLHLIGKINKCGAIKPRYPVGLDTYEKFEKRYLPAKGFGLIIVSTSKGIMVHEEAIEQKLGGKLIAYVY